MQLKLFLRPLKNLSAVEAEMNAFLRSHRVLAVKKEFVNDGENSFWTFCVTANHNNNNPANANNNIGFRSVRPPAQPRDPQGLRLTRPPSCP